MKVLVVLQGPAYGDAGGVRRSLRSLRVACGIVRSAVSADDRTLVARTRPLWSSPRPESRRVPGPHDPASRARRA